MTQYMIFKSGGEFALKKFEAANDDEAMELATKLAKKHKNITLEVWEPHAIRHVGSITLYLA